MRGLQGFAGGVLIPMAFTMVLTKLPKAQQPIGLALFALSVTFAPAIGPTIGGYLTENYGWQTIFFVNTPPSVVMVVALCLHAREDSRCSCRCSRRATGPASSPWRSGSRRCRPCSRKATRTTGSSRPSSSSSAIVAAVFLDRLRLASSSPCKKPLVKLRLLKRRNFGIGVLVNVLVGFALFGTVYILPQYLGQVQRYNAEQIGNVLAWTGLPQLLLIPLVPLLMKRFDVALHRLRRHQHLRRELLHEHHAVARQRRRPVLHARTSCAPSARRWC